MTREETYEVYGHCAACCSPLDLGDEPRHYGLILACEACLNRDREEAGRFSIPIPFEEFYGLK